MKSRTYIIDPARYVKPRISPYRNPVSDGAKMWQCSTGPIDICLAFSIQTAFDIWAAPQPKDIIKSIPVYL